MQVVLRRELRSLQITLSIRSYVRFYDWTVCVCIYSQIDRKREGEKEREKDIESETQRHWEEIEIDRNDGHCLSHWLLFCHQYWWFLSWGFATAEICLGEISSIDRFIDAMHLSILTFFFKFCQHFISKKTYHYVYQISCKSFKKYIFKDFFFLKALTKWKLVSSYFPFIKESILEPSRKHHSEHQYT